MSESSRFQTIGTRPIRSDGVDKVTGRAQYGADIRLPGMLYGVVKRSTQAHALIQALTAGNARMLPGVKAVITRQDLPSKRIDEEGFDESTSLPEKFFLDNILADDRVLYYGQAIAAVAASDFHTAEDALELINIEYDPLAPVLDIKDAMSGTAIIHKELRTRETGITAPENVNKQTNIAGRILFTKGDIEAGLSNADVVIEREFKTSMVHQGYIEPQNTTAFWNKDGKLTIWTSTQGSFMVRSLVARVLRLPVSDIEVIPTEIGGGFGGKTTIYLEPLAAILSKKTGKPVKMTMKRNEVFEATGPTSGTYCRVKLGAKQDGTLTSAEVYLAYEAGAFPGSPVNGAAICSLAPYDVPNATVEGYDVIVNKPKTAAYRAPGAPAAAFAVETTINELAYELKIDPIDLRLKNAAKEGTVQVNGRAFRRIGAVEVMEAMQNHPHYRSPIDKNYCRGRGIAIGFWPNASGERSAMASLNPDGTINLVTGNVDIGGTRSAIAMMLAESLGIHAEDIKHHVVGTADIGATGMTGGSSSAFASGWAMYELAQLLKKELSQRVAKIWECQPEDVNYTGDGFLVASATSEGMVRKMSFREASLQLSRTGGSISASVTSNHSGAGPAFAGHIVDVEVDKQTGKVQILRYTAFQDVGQAIHPSYVEGQIQGGAAQGIGMALNEEYCFDLQGQMQNASFLDYRMPTALDVPMIDTVLIQVPNPGHPFGVRGVGEVSIVPPLPAIRAAIYDATGVQLYKAPMSPRHVLEKLLP